VAFPQGALPTAVKVRVTEPASLSAALGVYTGVKVVPPVKVPVPEVAQLTEALFVAEAPDTVKVAELEHMD
jgi:hypothetical protein